MAATDLTTSTAPDGTVLRDLDHDGVVAPFEDPRRSPAADLASQLVNHLDVHAMPSPRESAARSNALHALTATTPHAIPVSISALADALDTHRAGLDL